MFNIEDSAHYGHISPSLTVSAAISNWAEEGVVGILTGLIGNMKAVGTFKWIICVGFLLIDMLLVYDSLSVVFYPLYRENVATEFPMPKTIVKIEKWDYTLYFQNRTAGVALLAKPDLDKLRHNPSVALIDMCEWDELPLPPSIDAIRFPLSDWKDHFPPIENNTIVFICQSGQ